MNGNYAGRDDYRLEENHQESGPVVAPRARRAGGYGGFMSDNLPVASEDAPAIPQRQRPYDQDSNRLYTQERPDREVGGYNAHGRNSSGDRDGRTMHDARTYGNGPGGRQIEGQSTTMGRLLDSTSFPRQLVIFWGLSISRTDSGSVLN